MSCFFAGGGEFMIYPNFWIKNTLFQQNGDFGEIIKLKRGRLKMQKLDHKLTLVGRKLKPSNFHFIQ